MDNALEKEDAYKLYNIYRDYVKHEDSLVNVRVTLFLTVEAFLFSAYALLNQQKLQNGNFLIVSTTEEFRARFASGLFNFNSFLLLLICSFGFLVARRSYVSVRAAKLAIETLNRGWDENVAPNFVHLALPGLIGGGNDKAKTEGWMSSESLPLLATWLWVLIAIFHIFLVKS